MYEVFNGTMPMHAVAMCVLLNIALLLSIAALIKYLIKARCACQCGCACCDKKKQDCGTANSSCCK